MRLRFLGSGDAFGSGGRFNTCFRLDWSGGRVLIDCGASSMIAMNRFGIDPNSVDGILISHLHGDHFGGLPFLLLHAQYVARRDRPLVLAGPPGLADRLHAAREVLFPGSTACELPFPLEIRELAAERTSDVLGLTVTPWEVEHYSGAPPYALRIEADGRTLCYSGDTCWTPALIPAARGADLFVCEAYTYDTPLKMHLNVREIEAHLPELEVRRLILTHMGEDMVARSATCGHETASDGLEVEV